MAKKPGAKKDVVETKLTAIAEQLGWLLGTAQNKVEELRDNPALNKQLRRMRDGAVDLLDQMNRARKARQKSRAKKKKKAVARPNRGPVDAPGKKHRKPPPSEKFERHMGEPKVQQMGQKGIKGRMQRGRG